MCINSIYILFWLLFASISCSCTDIVGLLAGRILRQCIGTYSEGSRWHSNVDNSQCAIINSDITSTLCNLALVSIKQNYHFSYRSTHIILSRILLEKMKCLCQIE